MYSLQKYGVLSVFVLLSGIFFSCDRSKSFKKELAEPVFRAVLTDAFMAEAYIQEEASYKKFSAASLMNRKIYPLILEKHGVDSAAFIHTFDYYLHRPDEFRQVLSKVVDTLNIILENAPLASKEPLPLPVPEEIQSDSILAEDAMSRFRLLQNKNQGAPAGKKSN